MLMTMVFCLRARFGEGLGEGVGEGWARGGLTTSFNIHMSHVRFLHRKTLKKGKPSRGKKMFLIFSLVK